MSRDDIPIITKEQFEKMIRKTGSMNFSKLQYTRRRTTFRIKAAWCIVLLGEIESVRGGENRE